MRRGQGPSMLISLAAATGLAALGMLVVWVVAERIRNAGIVDIAWAASLTPLTAVYLALESRHARATLLAILTTAWSLRLGGYLYRRVMRHHPVEDSRYQHLRRDWAPRASRRFFWFFQAQALAAVFFSIPMWLVAADADGRVEPWHWGAALLGVVALAGESLADWQLSRHKADPSNAGRTCDVGLWRHSRHPNYFFEWLVWCAFALYALASPLGWIALACPAAMLVLLFRVTGIPATEAAAVARRGEEYRRYQRTTSAFVPWFRKRDGAAR